MIRDPSRDSDSWSSFRGGADGAIAEEDSWEDGDIQGSKGLKTRAPKTRISFRNGVLLSSSCHYTIFFFMSFFLLVCLCLGLGLCLCLCLFRSGMSTVCAPGV